ncbi:MAG: GyrI-like domain-containing protein [Ferruginibacter sp.]
MKKIAAILPLSLFVCFMLFSCKEKKSNNITNRLQPPVKTKKDSTSPVTNAGRPPIINIVDTIAPKKLILFVSDSAATSERISGKLSLIFKQKLGEYIKKQQLLIDGYPMVWYKTNKAPFYFEAGIPITKKPVKLPKGIMVKNIGGDSAIIAHYYGPYSKTNMAYDALTEWAKDNKKKKKGNPYEVYVTDPIGTDGKPLDPYKVQTDIVFPRN